MRENTAENLEKIYFNSTRSQTTSADASQNQISKQIAIEKK